MITLFIFWTFGRDSRLKGKGRIAIEKTIGFVKLFITFEIVKENIAQFSLAIRFAEDPGKFGDVIKVAPH